MLHWGWHVEPDARFEVQSPGSPFVGFAEASQGLGKHVAAVSIPALQLEVPDAV